MSEGRETARGGQPETVEANPGFNGPDLFQMFAELRTLEIKFREADLEERRMMRATLQAVLTFCKANGSSAKQRGADPVAAAIQEITLDLMGGRTPNLTQIGLRVGMTPHGLRKNATFKAELKILEKRLGGRILKGVVRKDSKEKNSMQTVDGVVSDERDNDR